ncbi:MAG: glycosyltransferase [Actinomycetota bacterium]|nr:glycosyltransferase [Actinomycetota bacterium]
MSTAAAPARRAAVTPLPAPARRQRRVALYSHDTQGLGHVRRNTLIAAALVEADPATDVLLLTGAPEAAMLPLPPSTELLTLPALHKDAAGHYAPRILSTPLEELLTLRARLIESALTSFDPDLVIVDKAARGVGGELDPALSALRRTGSARMVLGLRDVLDDPEVTRHEWHGSRTVEAVRDLYDQVWVYGDPRLYDARVEYVLPPVVTDKVVFTGYVGGRRPGNLRTRYRTGDVVHPPGRPYVLCTVGGGQDGGTVARAVVDATMPPGHDGILLTGPYMPSDLRRQLLRAAERRPDLHVHEFVPDADQLVAGAAAAVAMGGYNTVCELLAAGLPTLLVPRVTPRTEQAIRAERLQRAGLVTVLAPASATPQRLSAWFRHAVTARRTPHPVAVDLGGLDRIPALADRLVDRPRAVQEVHRVAI